MYIGTYLNIFKMIKMSDSEWRGQEEATCTHIKAHVTTTVSYLLGWQLKSFKML